MIIDITRELDDHKEFEMNLIEKRGRFKKGMFCQRMFWKKKKPQMNYGIATWNIPNSMTLTSQQFGTLLISLVSSSIYKIALTTIDR